jgi:hypothetical protein
VLKNIRVPLDRENEIERKEKKMKIRTLMIVAMTLMLLTGSALAQTGGMGHMPGPMPGPYPGPVPGPYPPPDPGPYPGPYPGGGIGCGRGYGTDGVGGMGRLMFGNTIYYGYLNRLNPIADATEARALIQAFINESNSTLQISELWEYATVYKAELSDTNGAKAFDLIADKFTGIVRPEMGMSMMLNASYGKHLYRRLITFRKNLSISPEQATYIAQTFVYNNGLGYTLGTPEIYPGYYKFHTTYGSGFGMDIMINGYNGYPWMDTILGLPLNKY